ncbi:MAG: hypothetical protein M1537_01855 [Nitrospirae bacterium]|nr:hypothetical protein [Nitrospirota bacterium]MCL5284213.1 hypothetical protein [Nitrospirota bacterium]
MEEVKEEAGRISGGKTNPGRRIPGKVLFRIFLRKIRRKTRAEEPWARIRVRRGIKTLEWGMGDGKTFGFVPMGTEGLFSVDAEGVKLNTGNGDRDPVLIGSPGNEPGNALLARKIEKIFRNPGIPSWIFWIVWGSGSVVLLAGIVAVVGSGVSGLSHLASLSPDLSGSGGGSLPAMSDIPSSMSSGLTCRTH